MRRHDDLTEGMDAPDVDPDDLARALRCIRGVNHFLGGTTAVLGHLQCWARRWQTSPERPLILLDVATGSADIPEAIVRWARGAGHHLRVCGLDLHPTTLRLARDWTIQNLATPDGADVPIRFVRGDALALPLADRSVDYAICSMFLHHLPNEQARQVIAEMLRVSRRGIIVNDLLRNIPAKIFIHLLTVPAGKLEQHDARVSVAKAWVKREVLAWRSDLQAPWLRYHRHLFSRFTLAGERPEAVSTNPT